MTRRWFPLFALAVVVYLAWRLATVIQTPTIASGAFLTVELLAWLGFGAFLLRVSTPSHPSPAHVEDVPAPAVVVAVLGAGRPQSALERSILSLDPSRTKVFLVDDGHREPTGRVAVDDLANSVGGSIVVATSDGMTAAVAALASHVNDDAVLVLLEAGSVLAASGLDALVEPMRDPSVGAVQGAVGWADSSTLNLHGPSRDGLDLFVGRDAPTAGQAGVAPILGNGSALRVRALRDVGVPSGDLGVALVAKGWSARFSSVPVVFRPRPASAGEWRIERTSELASARRRASSALVARGIRPAPRARIVAGAGDIFSAFARLGLVAMVIAALLTGTVPVPGPLGVTLIVAGSLWALAAWATRIAVAPVLQFGDHVRLGWHRLDADALAAFVSAGARSGSAPRSRVRALAAFPLSVLALLVIDCAGVVRALTLVDPGIVAPIATTLARATIGVATLASLALLFDALRIFVARPDARDDLRVGASIPVVVNRVGESDTTLADVVDISTVGAGLLTDVTLVRGDHIHLQFELPGATQSIDVDVTVARTVGEGAKRRVGVEFGVLDTSTRRALTRYIATNPPVPASPQPAAVAFARNAAMPIPKPVLRFASVIAVIVTTTALVVGPAAAAPISSGTLSGTVSGPSGPVANICVSAVTDSWQWFGTQTDDSGSYTLPVPSDVYRIQFRDCRPVTSDRLVTGWWSAGGVVGQDQAARVTVADAQSNLDVTLQAGGWFAGTIQDPTGAPVDGICVNPVSVATNSWDGGTVTPANGGATGSVQTDALMPGQYQIHVNDCSGRAEPFAQGWLAPDGTNLVAIQADAKVFDLASDPIDLGAIHLVAGTRLTGTVRDDTGAPAAGVCVGIDSQNWSWIGGGQTASDGSYVTDPVLPGTWILAFNDCRQQRTLVNTLWTGTNTIVNDINAATPIAVDGSSRQLGPYDQVMFRGGTVSGSVISDSGPIAGACVNAVVVSNNNWQWVGGTQSAPDGTFNLGPVVGDNISIEVDQCQSSTPILNGLYAGPEQPLTRDSSRALMLEVGPDAPVTDLQLRPELGTILSGTVTGNGAPLTNACVSVVDPDTGAADSQNTESDGQWSITVPQGSYLVEALDCSPGRGFVGRFSVDATDPSHATRVVTNGAHDVSSLDMNLPVGTPTSIKGRVVTGNGEVPVACVVAVAPNSEPAAIVQVASDGSFDLGPLNPGSYMVGLAGCDFSGQLPPGITDPSDPSIVYPLQWSSGTPLAVDNLWIEPPWVTAASGTPTDLGTICLAPCNKPTPPTTTTVPPTTTLPPTTTVPPQTTVPPTAPPTTPPPGAPVVPPGTNTLFVQHNLAPVAVPPAQPEPPVSATQQAAQSIPPPPAPKGTVATQAEVHAVAVTREPRVAPVTFRKKLDVPSPQGSSSWWWLFVVAAVIGLGAATIPWYRRRRIARSARAARARSRLA